MAENNPFTSGQAPATSMAGWALAPDIASQQLMLQRRNAIAQLLTQQGSKDAPQTQVIGGWAVPQSPMEGLGRMAQLLMGTYMQSTNDEKNADLSRQYAQILKAQADADPMAPATPTSAQPQQAAQPTDLANGAGNAPQSQSGFAPPSGNTQAVSPAPQVPQSIPTAPTQGQRFMSAFAKGQIYGDNAAKAYLADTAKTDTEKVNNYLGINSDQAKALELAKRLKDGTLSMTPGQTNRMPDGTFMVAPDFNAGIAGGFDANGRPIVSPIQGAPEAAAAQAGAIEASKVKAGLLPTSYVGADGRPLGGTVGEYLGKGSNTPSANLPTPFLQSEASASQTAGLPGGFLPAIRQIESGSTLGATNKNTNGTIDHGIYQINSVNKGMNGDNPADAANLAAAAYKKANGDPALAAIYYHGGLNTNPNSAENQRYASKFIQAYGSLGSANTNSAAQITPPAVDQNGRPLLQSAAEAQAALDKEKLNMQPRIAQSTKTAENMATYEENLNNKVSKSQDLLQRLQYTNQALQSFPTGGGKEARAAWAEKAQMLGLPQNWVDKLAGGDLGAAQTINKLAIQESIQNMQGALANDTGPTQRANKALIEDFQKSNPNLDTDPRAFEKMMNLQMEIHNRNLQHSNAYFKYKTENGGDTSAFPNKYANDQVNSGAIQSPVTNNKPYATPTQPTGQGVSKTTVPPNIQALLNKYGAKK